MAVPPQARGTEPLFAVYHEFVEPNPEGNVFLSHYDIIHAVMRAAADNGMEYDEEHDHFYFAGIVWKMADAYYIARKINTDHPDAFNWLVDNGYDVEGAPMGWVWEFIFDNGRSLTTAHRYSLRSTRKIKFGQTPFWLLDTAVVNINRVVHATSFYANLDLHVAHIQKNSR